MRWQLKALLFLMLSFAAGAVLAQSESDGTRSKGGDLQLVERLLIARRDYQKTL